MPAAPVIANEPDRADEAEEAAAFYLLKRAPDGKNLPTERYLAQREALSRMRTHSIARGGFVSGLRPHDAYSQPASTGWVPLGPGNVGGRTRALVINKQNPLVMYAGTSGGGVWKTLDGGKNWNPLTDLIPSLAVDTLAMDPNAPDTLYAGTGEPTGSVARRGAGIFKTTDGGVTWNQLPGTANNNFYFVNEVLVSPNNSNNVYAATETGVFFSPDAGATWTRSLERATPNSGCQQIIIRTDQPTDSLFASCGRNNTPPSAIFRNTDAAGAGAWTQVLTAPGMGRSSIAVAPSNQSIVYALLSSVDPRNPTFLNALLAVYRSDSNGDPDSWTPLVQNTDSSLANVSILSYPNATFGKACGGTAGDSHGQSYLDIILVVDPVNPDRVWAGGIDVFRSDDGGNNWGIAGFWETGQPLGPHADNHRLVFHPAYDGVTNQTLFNTSDGGIFYTDNANDPVATGDRAGCSPYSTKVAWKSLNHTFNVTEFHHGAAYPAGQWYIGGAQDNGTVRGGDALGSEQWRTIASGDGGYIAINPADPNVVYHEFSGLSLVKSTDGGVTFTSAIRGITESSSNFQFIPPFVLDPTNPNRLYTGGLTVWRSDDAAATWSPASAPLSSSTGGVSTLAVSAADSNRVLIGTSGGRVYRNTNATAADGTTVWDVSLPRSGFVASIAFDPTTPDVAYAAYATFKSGTQNYIYKTVDGGLTWTGSDGSGDSALPDAPVSSVLVDPLNNSTIFAGTDLGVFVSVDGGLSWAREDTPFVNTPIVNLALDRSTGPTYLFAFTTGRGVWRIPLSGSAPPCQYTLSGNKVSSPAYGANVPFDLKTGDGCRWVALPGGSVFGVKSPASGAGSGTVTIAVPMNTTTLTRTGTVFVQDQQVAVTQTGALSVSRNDENTSAATIALLPYVGIEDTRLMTANAADPVHSCSQSADFKSAWWRVTPAASGTLHLGVQAERYDVFGNSGFVAAVYDGQAVDANEIGCFQHRRDTTTWQMVTADIPVTAGKTYLIEVSATGSAQADGGFTIVSAALLP